MLQIGATVFLNAVLPGIGFIAGSAALAVGLFGAGLSPTAQFVGSFRVDIATIASEDANYLEFTVTNNTSMKSFAYGIGPAYERGTFGPGGNMRQTYTWIEKAR